MTLHANEFAIDLALVERLLADQMPHWSGLPLRRLATSGTVSAAFRLGEDRLVRMPRIADFSGGPLREARWIPVFAPLVPLKVPNHLALGEPTAEYPSHWSVLEWIEGEPASRAALLDHRAAAVALGEFVVDLRAVSTDGAPEGGNYRAFGLRRADRDFRHWLDQLSAEFDENAILAVWESCLSAGEWDGNPTWLHSDLRGDNPIAHDGVLVGVIDWEGCTVGDPCADYLSAW